MEDIGHPKLTLKRFETCLSMMSSEISGVELANCAYCLANPWRLVGGRLVQQLSRARLYPADRTRLERPGFGGLRPISPDEVDPRALPPITSSHLMFGIARPPGSTPSPMVPRPGYRKFIGGLGPLTHMQLPPARPNYRNVRKADIL